MISLLSGNSRILLNIDERGAWSQLYYPFPGLHQQLHHARLGLFDADSKAFTWVDQEGDLPVEMRFLPDSNVGRTRFERLDLELTVDDMVHPSLDLVIRRITLRNPHNQPRSMRLFHYQGLSMASTIYQDTAYWDDERQAVVHYKRGYYVMLWGRPDFTGHGCGEHTLKGLKGSYVDAEDGELDGNSISHGAADSVVQWDLDVGPGEERTVHLFVLIDRSRHEINAFQRRIKATDPNVFTAETLGYANNWVANKRLAVPTELSSRARDIYVRSLFVMRDCQAEAGSIIASPDFRTLRLGGDTYSYCWWRDGAIISRAMGEAGMQRNVTAFLRFAARCQEKEGYFVHRHFPDGSVGSTWHPPPFLQIDQTASVIEALHHHYRSTGSLDALLPFWDLARRGADFLMGFVDDRGLPLPSYDLWEERKGVQTYSVAAVIAGLRAAALMGKALARRSELWSEAANRMQTAALDELWNADRGTFLKSTQPRDETVDASVLLALLYGLVPPTDPRYAQAVRTIEETLWVQETGGISRYEGDTYYGTQNAWVICTLWLARCHLELGDLERSRALIDWCAEHASATDLLPEQIDRMTGEHTSVTPLVWSHSTFVETVNAYAAALRNAPAREKAFTPLVTARKRAP